MKLGKQRQLLLTLILAAAPSHASPIVRAMSMPLHRLGRLYGSALSKNPVLTHCFQGAAISGIGLAAGSLRGVRVRSFRTIKTNAVQTLASRFQEHVF